MKKLLSMIIAIAIAITVPGMAFAKNVGTYEAFKDSTSGVSQFTSVPGSAIAAWIQPNGGAIRYKLDGTDPGPQDGFLLTDGKELGLKTPYQVNGFRWTLDSGESGVTVDALFIGKD